MVSVVLRRLEARGLWNEDQLIEHLRHLSERPPRREVGLLVPNPDQWLRACAVPYRLSGEVVAARDGIDVVPERFLAYVREEHVDAALRAALDVMGKVAPSRQANLILRIADPWLSDGESDDVVERGQRVLDYAESPNIQLAKGARRAG